MTMPLEEFMELVWQEAYKGAAPEIERMARAARDYASMHYARRERMAAELTKEIIDERNRPEGLLAKALLGCGYRYVMGGTSNALESLTEQCKEIFGPTAEERAVLEAALELQGRWYLLPVERAGEKSRVAFDAWHFDPFLHAVDRLAASRKPQPRYYVRATSELSTLSHSVYDAVEGETVAFCVNRTKADKLAVALNAAEEKA